MDRSNLTIINEHAPEKGKKEESELLYEQLQTHNSIITKFLYLFYVFIYYKFKWE